LEGWKVGQLEVKRRSSLITIKTQDRVGELY